jgi:SPX domain protein involved in polyphosphate accumulation
LAAKSRWVPAQLRTKSLLSIALKTDIYTEWREYYLDYTKLKKYIKENNKRGQWTQESEQGFINLLEMELEKIQNFQASKVRSRASGNIR